MPFEKGDIGGGDGTPYSFARGEGDGNIALTPFGGIECGYLVGAWFEGLGEIPVATYADGINRGSGDTPSGRSSAVAGPEGIFIELGLALQPRGRREIGEAALWT